MVSVPESAMEEIPLREEESSMEYRMLMAYAQRVLPASKFAHLIKPVTAQDDTAANSNKESKTAVNGVLPHKKHKKSLRKRLTPKCLRPAKDGKEDPEEKHEGGLSEERRARSIARRVQGIIQRIKQREGSGFKVLRRTPSVQPDGGDEDELIADIVQLLRSAGDNLNDQMTKDRSLLERVRALLSYSFFRDVTDHYLSDAAAQSEEDQQMDRIALCVHATAALTTLDNQPMNRVLGFGVRYLRENYSPWIQSRGGWEAVMGVRDDDQQQEEVE